MVKLNEKRQELLKLNVDVEQKVLLEEGKLNLDTMAQFGARRDLGNVSPVIYAESLLSERRDPRVVIIVPAIPELHL